MTLHLWLVYIGVITALIAVPGPSALLSMTHGLRYGQRRALATVLG
ncbi:LysE family translocator, partial [Dickeya dadantii]|nr:LysE family translocator [Dickeya dadantii]